MKEKQKAKRRKLKFISAFRFLLSVVVLSFPYCAFAESAPSDQQVKAAFLANFPKYVEWPSDAFASSNAPIVIGILGGSKLTDTLREIIRGKTANGRAIILKVLSPESRVHSPDSELKTPDSGLRSCHILFIGDAERRRMATTLERLKGTSVLTVSESEEFLSKGGAISFVLREQKVRLQINLDVTRGAGLKVSSKLLGVADVVKGKSN